LSAAVARIKRPSAEYWSQSGRPLVSLVFVLPLLIGYEGGVLALGAEATRNGVDVWLRHFLLLLGFGQYFLLPVLTCVVLLAWHHLTQQRWGVSQRVVLTMWLESALLALALLLASPLIAQLATGGTAAPLSISGNRLIAYLGAGLYEELLFRLMLLPVAIGILRSLGLTLTISNVLGVVACGLIFAGAHYDIFTTFGDPFQWHSFLFRTMAGVFFSVLFLVRGFGVAAGTHALYDVFTLI